MSVTVQIDVPRGAAGRRLAAIQARLSPLYIYRAMAQGALPVAQRHIIRNAQRERNPYGVRSTFWMRMHAGTRAESTDSEAAVVMPREVAQRYFGGTITPKGGRKWITIPARAEAYGKSARQFNDLRFVADKEGGAMLIQNEQTRLQVRYGRRRKDGTRRAKVVQGEETGGQVMYWLRRSVTQRGDRTLLPDGRTLRAGAMAGVRALVRATIETERRNQAGAS